MPMNKALQDAAETLLDCGKADHEIEVVTGATLLEIIALRASAAAAPAATVEVARRCSRSPPSPA